MKRPFVWLLIAALISIGIQVAAANGITIELNKFEDQDGACRAYLVFQNQTDATFSEFKLDLVMFDTDSVIAKRLAVDASPLRPAKTSVKLFDIDGLACGDISRILINDVIACRDQDGERLDCITAVTPVSRNTVAFIK